MLAKRSLGKSGLVIRYILERVACKVIQFKLDGSICSGVQINNKYGSVTAVKNAPTKICALEAGLKIGPSTTFVRNFCSNQMTISYVVKRGCL
jgi:hypothetical protein